MLALLTLSVYPAALLIAAANDLYEFKIPNWVSLTLFLAYFAAGAVNGASLALIGEGLMISAAMLTVSFILFARNVIGGGDAKLLAAIAPWIGLSSLTGFLFNMAFAGGAMAIALIIFRKTPALPVYAHAPWVLRLHQRPKEMPYAVPIAAGGLLSFPQTPYFHLVFGG